MTDSLDDLRKIDGFPKGREEDLLSLSNPPYFTAFPNPHIEEFIQDLSKPYSEISDEYHKEPYVDDEEYGRTDEIYNCHSYHTKVPPQAIQKYIEHYTSENDIVLDFFAGTGMTGVAAWRSKRNAILIDLSPIATFISSNNSSRVSSSEVKRIGNEILSEVRGELGYFYQTNHTPKQKGNIVYTIWSDVVQCSYCKKESSYWSLYHQTPESIRGQIKGQTHIQCVCGAVVNSGDWPYVLSKNGKRTQVPVKISYSVGKSRYFKTPDADDIKLVERIDNIINPYWVPQDLYMHKSGKWGDQWRGYHVGIDSVADFYMKRNLLVLSAIYDRIMKVNEISVRNKLLYTFTATLPRVNRLNRYMPEHNRHVGPLSGTLYMSKLPVEINVLENFEDKLDEISKASISNINRVIVSTQSASDLSQVKANSIDYVFIDPPFGDNLPYAELNFITEAWLRVFTNISDETIVSETQSKNLETYRQLMLKAFQEGFRVLKPGRWITVEFHNSKAAIWNAIQDSLLRAGFIVAQVVILDKKKGTTKQLTYPGTVEKDLIIHAYKPRNSFTSRLISVAGRGLETEFVREHLHQLPIRPNVERSKEMLYSKYLAYYIQHGYQVMYNSEQFYRALPSWGLEERDGYWFADEEEVNEYEKNKVKTFGKAGIQPQAVLFISDERSARQWIWNFLDQPKTYDEIYTDFLKALQTSEDDIPEVKEILEESFVRTNGHWKRPDQLTQAELEKKRQERLLRQFEEYLNLARANQKLKEVRLEAVIAGFTECYRAGRFKDILTVGRKLGKSLLENSTDLYDFIDIAEAKIEG